MLVATVILLLVAVNAFFVAAEYSIVGFRRARVRQLVREGSFLARLLAPYALDVRGLDRAITACQIGISASSIALGAYAQTVVAPLLSPHLVPLIGPVTAVSVAAALTLVGVTATQVIFGEQVPKSLAVRHIEPFALNLILPLKLSLFLLAPFIFLLSAVSRVILRALGIPELPKRSIHSAAEIGLLVAQSARAGGMHRDLGERLRSTIRFAGLRARDVMIPRVRMRAVQEDITLKELRRTIRETGHTRLFVFRDTPDNITGVIHAKDVFLEGSRPDAPPVEPASVMRPVMFFPWSTPAVTILDAMRAGHKVIAVVLDEYGGTAGIVTLEDLVEEVMGEVEDEFDPSAPASGTVQDGRVRLRAEDSLAWVNARYGLTLRSDQARTVGGLVMEMLERVALPGDRVECDGIVLVVEEVRGRRIETVMAARPEPAPGSHEGGGAHP